MTHRAYRALLLRPAARFPRRVRGRNDRGLRRPAPAHSGAGVIGLWLVDDSRSRRPLRAPALRSAAHRPAPLASAACSRQKTFTLTAVTTLALALGPMTAVISLVNGVLLDPLPGATDLDRVVFAWTENPGAQPPRVPVERAELRRSSRAQAGPVGVWRVRPDERHHRRRRAAAGRRRVGLGRHVRRARHLGRARPPLRRRGHAAGRAADDHPRPRLRPGALSRTAMRSANR